MGSTSAEEAKAFLEIMKQLNDSDSDEEVLKNAFEALDKALQTVDPADLFCEFMKNRGVKLSIEEVKETIDQVQLRTKNENINRDEFIEIVKLLKNPTVMEQLNRTYKALGAKRTFVLYGERGVGKTWMAKKIADHAVRLGKFDLVLWIYLDGIYSTSTLQESIVRQLSNLPISDELQAAKPVEESIHFTLAKKRLLLVFDDDGNKMKISPTTLDENELLLETNNETGEPKINLYKTLALDKLESYKLLVTRKELLPGESGMTVMPLTRDEAISFMEDGNIKDLADFLIGKSRRFPSEVLIISKTLGYFGQSKTKLQKLEYDIEKLKEDKKDQMSFEDLKMLLINGYDKLPKSVLIDCFSSETSEGHFLNRGKMVDYNELIGYWIMEEHLSPFNRIEDAYEEGHRVLMELIECGLLRNQESGWVVSGGEKFDFDVREYYDFFRSIRLGLATSFDNKYGKIAATHGMLRTISTTSSGQKNKKMSTLLLDGNYIGGMKTGEIFNAADGKIENLAVFKPTGKYFPLSMSKMKNLCLLVLRGCEFLDTTERIFDTFKNDKFRSDCAPDSSSEYISLENLTILEISGPSSLKEISNQIFESMRNLKNLNLSKLQIESLPESFYICLVKLETLILRGCSSLKELGSLKKLINLEVLDVSGSESISSIVDKSFSKNEKLRIINLSRTKIETLPLVHSLKNLKSLSLTDCSYLSRIRKINKVKSLQILDISGASEVKEFLDPSLGKLEKLDFLDASKTKIVKLPSNIGNPRYLYLRNCPLLEKLPPIEGLSKIQVLDLSGSSKLRDIRAVFFEKVESLRELNLSKTSIDNLSFLSHLGTLRKLCVSHCPSLEKFENISSGFRELEILDFSGCEHLKEIEDEAFDKMPCLYSLDLSGLTQLDKLPSLSKLVSLKNLSVKNCPKITEMPGLEEIPALETLDHSGTYLKPSPKFHPDCHPDVQGPISVSSEKIDAMKLLTDLGAGKYICELTTHPENEQGGSNYEECNWIISNWQGEENGHSVPVSGVHFLPLLKMYPSLVPNIFEENFLIHPSEAQAAKRLPGKQDYSDEIGLREVYLSQVTDPQNFKKRLEIRGFNYAPLGVEHLLQETEFIFVVDSPFLRSLHELGPGAGVENVIRACWIERCNEMEHVRTGKNNNNLDNLEVLWISDVMKLKRIFSLTESGENNMSFQSLKSLYLEFCPNLEVLCSSYSQLQNLEILYIKYCQKLSTIFSDESLRMDKLCALHLWGLPELKKVAFSDAQSLSTLRIGECPLLESIVISAPEKLEVVHVKFCDKLLLETAFPYNNLPALRELEVWGLPKVDRVGFRAPNVKRLKIAECPALLEVSVDDLDAFSDQGGRLEIVEVKCCDKLNKIKFQGGGGITERYLKVDRLELLCLPELESIGVDEVIMNCNIWGCPKIKIPKLPNSDSK